MNMSINTPIRIMWFFTLSILIICAYLTFSAENEIAWYKLIALDMVVIILFVPITLFISGIIKNNGELSFERLFVIFLCLMSLKFCKVFITLNGGEPAFTDLITKLEIATEPFVIMYLLVFPTFLNLKNSKENNNV